MTYIFQRLVKKEYYRWTTLENTTNLFDFIKVFYYFGRQGTEYLSRPHMDDEDDDEDDENDSEVVIASLVAPQSGSGRQQQQIGWLCGEPMPDYAHVVFKSTR